MDYEYRIGNTSPDGEPCYGGIEDGGQEHFANLEDAREGLALLSRDFPDLWLERRPVEDNWERI